MESMNSVPTAMAQDFMRDLINYEPLIARLALDLQRMEAVVKPDGTIDFKQHGKPRMSVEGVRDLIARIRAVLNPNTAYGYQEQEQYQINMRMDMDTLAVHLFVNRKKWGIESTDYFVICDMLDNILSSANSKAVGKNFQEFTSSSRTSQETIIMENQNKSGLLSGIFGPSQKKVM
jgi:hypothetical protein